MRDDGDTNDICKHKTDPNDSNVWSERERERARGGYEKEGRGKTNQINLSSQMGKVTLRIGTAEDEEDIDMGPKKAKK